MAVAHYRERLDTGSVQERATMPTPTLNGHFDDHHSLARMLNQIDTLDADIAAIDEQIEVHLAPPLRWRRSDPMRPHRTIDRRLPWAGAHRSSLGRGSTWGDAPRRGEPDRSHGIEHLPGLNLGAFVEAVFVEHVHGHLEQGGDQRR